MPLLIDISGCNRTSCTVYDQQWVTMTGEMLAVDDAKYLRMEVAARILGFKLSYQIPIHRFNACEWLPKGCPLKKGYRYPIFVSGQASHPFKGATKILEVGLRNENNTLMLCGRSTLRFEKKKKSD